MQKKNSLKKVPVRDVLAAYLHQTLEHPVYFVVVALGTFLAPIAELIAPLYLREFFNVLATGSVTPETSAEMAHLILMFALFSFVGWAVFRTMLFCLTRLEVKSMRELVSVAFHYLIRHSHDFFSSNFAGSLTHKVNKFHRSFEVIIDCIVMTFVPTAVFVTGAAVILFIQNRALGSILAVWVVGIVLFQLYVARKRQPLRGARAEEETRLTGALADSIGNHLTSMLFSGAAHEDKRVDDIAGKWEGITRRYWDAEEIVWGALGLLMTALNVVLLWGAMRYWQAGLLTVGDFLLIQAYLLNSFGRLMGMNRELRRFFDAFADAGEMVTILRTPHEIRDTSGAVQLRVIKGAIAFRHVGYSFDNKLPVLEDFSLAIHSREKVALVGPSGAGKSTVTKLLLRFYDVKQGSIEIDDQDIKTVTQESLRDAIAFVPQEAILFHRSLMENIRYGRRDATDAEVVEAAKKAHCHEFISQLPDGYNTYVGERGVKLSGGERQRVAIARAILKDAPILVLDEATSSLDSESEALIQDALTKLMQDKTVIVIAHRLSTIMRMDRIIVVEGGKVVAQGTHSELLEHKGLYHKLWSIQAGGFIVDEDGPAPPAEALAEETKSA